MEVKDVPAGCQEMPGFIIPVHSMDTPAWLTLDGQVTRIWQERGIWDTVAEAREAITKFCR